MHKRRSLAAYILAFVLLVALATTASAQRPAAQASAPSEYGFVEIWTAVSGSGRLPRLCIDFPGYTYDPSTGQLAPFFPSAGLPALPPSAWGYAGNGHSRSGAAGCGVASDLAPIASLPYHTTVAIGTGATTDYGEQTRSADVELLAVAPDGQLSAIIDGTPVILAPGQRWSRVVGADLKNETFDGHYEITASVTYYGRHDRALIQGPTQFVWLPVMAR